MKLVSFSLQVTPFGNHYLYATYEGEAGSQFTPKIPYMWARSKELLLEKLSYGPSRFSSMVERLFVEQDTVVQFHDAGPL